MLLLHQDKQEKQNRYKTVESNLDLKDFFLELAKAKLYYPHSQECIEFDAKDRTMLKFILMVDEIDGIPHDIMIEFVKNISSIFIEQLSVEGFKAYIHILCGSADLASLPFGKTSPFSPIYLRDFSYEEILQWLTRIMESLQIQDNGSFVQQLFEQTQGQPYLTQMLCSRILASPSGRA